MDNSIFLKVSMDTILNIVKVVAELPVVLTVTMENNVTNVLLDII